MGLSYRIYFEKINIPQLFNIWNFSFDFCDKSCYCTANYQFSFFILRHLTKIHIAFKIYINNQIQKTKIKIHTKNQK